MPLIHFSATIQDGLGSKKTVDAYSKPADYSAVDADFAAWLTALDSIISGVIVASQVRLTPAAPTTLATTGRSGYAASRVEIPGGFRFNLSGTPKHYTNSVPAVNPSNITAGKLNLTSCSVYTALLTGNAYTDTTGNNAITSVNEGFLGSRTARKQLSSSSRSTP